MVDKIQINMRREDWESVTAQAHIDGKTFGEWMRDAIAFYIFVRTQERANNKICVEVGKIIYYVNRGGTS